MHDLHKCLITFFMILNVIDVVVKDFHEHVLQALQKNLCVMLGVLFKG